MVHAVRDRHPQVFDVDLRPAADHPDELAGYELGSHGVVCLTADGTVLWKHPGHDVTQEALDTAVYQIVKALKQKPVG